MKSKFLSEKYWNSGATAMAQAATLTNQKELINLSLGDPDFITNNEIIEATMNDAKLGHTKYTKTNGDPELIDEIIKHYKNQYNFNIKSDELMCSVGACHGMYLALQTIIDDGDEVIIPEPYFTPYKEQLALVNAKMITLKTNGSDGFSINVDDLEALITDKTKAIVINSPNNPTGAFYNKELLIKISSIAIKYDLLILSDEVYDDFIYNDTFCPIASLDGMKDRTITMGSFSKSFAMTGWRIGYVIAPSYIIECMKNINEGICFTAPSVSQRAALHALRMRDKVQPSMIEEFKQRMFYSYERIQNIKLLHVEKPSSSIYLFVDIRGTNMTSFEFAKLLLEQKCVSVIPGNAFGDSGEGYIRIACTQGIDKLEIAFDRIDDFIANICKTLL